MKLLILFIFIFLMIFIFVIIFIFLEQNKTKYTINQTDNNGKTHYKHTKLKKWLEGIPEYHYHGSSYVRPFNLKKSLEKRMVDLSRFINENNTLLDIGCGYGGYNKLINSIIPSVDITNLTISKEAASHCKKQGFKVINKDFIKYKAKQKYDVVVMNESFFYLGKTIPEKINVLKKIYSIADKLIAIILIHKYIPITWDNSGLSLSSNQLKSILTQTGWKIKYYKLYPYFEDKLSCQKQLEIIMSNKNKILNSNKIYTMPNEIKNWIKGLNTCLYSKNISISCCLLVATK